MKKAVGKAAYELETQRRLIQLLENSGRDDEALAQYEAVVRAAPGEARFQLELAERYWRRTMEKKALDTLARLQSRFPNDAGVLSAIADYYTLAGSVVWDIATNSWVRTDTSLRYDDGYLGLGGSLYFKPTTWGFGVSLNLKGPDGAPAF